MAWVMGVAVTVMWGVSFVATRVAVAEIPPLTLALARFGLAGVVMAPWIVRDLGRVHGGWADHARLVLVGVLGITAAFVLENLGLERTTATHGSLIVATTPLATAFAEAVWRRSWPDGHVLAGLTLSLTGVVLIVGRDDGGAASLAGDLLMAGTVVVWVAYSFLVARLATRYSTALITNLGILWGIVTLLPLAAVEITFRPLMRPGPEAVVAVVFLGLACSAVAYLWWNRALQVLGVTATNSLIYCVPVVAVAAAVLTLGEPLTREVVLGGALVVGGVATANGRWARRWRRPPS